jgi:NADP-dependent 3-hydroxy acid dehydrogenase YdfG
MQTVVIVGASSGMGRETAVLFARKGARVVASARREDRLLNLRSELAAEGREIEVYPADATNPRAMDSLAAFAGPAIDVLVYAAGTNTPDRALARLTPAVWDAMLAANLSGAYYATQAVLPVMREQKRGLIFYISSKSATAPDESGAAYQAAKRGLAGLAGAIRVEEKQNGIRTCVVCPGLTDTEILEKRLVKPSPEMLAKALRAEDVAELVLAIAQLPARAWVPEVHLFPAEL